MLTGKQKSFLRSLAHPLDALVQVGKAGLTDGVVTQVAEQLRAHELIKVRFAKECPAQPEEAASALVERTGCEIVQKSGRVLTVYRRHDHKPKIELPH